MRSRLPIKYRFAFAISLLVIPLLALLSLLYYWQFRNALNERVLLQLSSIKQLKSVQIEDYLLQEWNLFLSEARHPNDSKSGLINLSDQEFELDKIWPNLGNIKADGIYDLSPYSPDGRILLGFFFDRGQRPVIKISRALKIQEILLERTGMGETGETYLVGSDFHLRSSSRFYPDRSPSMIETQSAGVKRALDGEEGEALINDYRKIPVFSAFGKIEFKSISWAILSELDEKEAHLPLLAMRNRLILILMLVTIFTVLGAFILSLQLVKPLVRMKEYLARMASGAFPEQRITIERDDEIGDMFHALEQLIKSIKQTMMFADEIGRMNLDADYQLLGKGDRLGRSLIAMREKL
ncbi:MAG: HAMP domain-containing protein, partial [Saprospiraceae bacterium]|nr:HAMP domain-containing protein [Saprospiraceae bacterium]